MRAFGGQRGGPTDPPPGFTVIDTFRRNTQRVHVEQMGEKLNGRGPAGDDVRSLARAELETLSADVTRGVDQEDPWEMMCWPDYGIYRR